MNHIVLDLEWNQAAHPARAVTKPLRLNGGIVQMGAAKMDENYRLTDTFKATVSPKYYKKMHRKVREITGLTSDDLSGGVPFSKAMEDFLSWCGEDWDLFAWGPDDEGVLRDNLIISGMDPACVPLCRNLQLIFDDQITRLNRCISLSFAMETVGESLVDAHDALNDAVGAAKICAHLDMAKGLRDYPALWNQITPPSLFTEELPRIYSSKRAILSDPEVLTVSHPILTGKLSCGEWAAASVWKYYAEGSDESGREYFVSIKLIRKEDGKFRVSRTVHPLNGKLHTTYQNKKVTTA